MSGQMKVIGELNLLICSINRNFRSFGKSSHYRNDIDYPKLLIFREINELKPKHGFEQFLVTILFAKITGIQQKKKLTIKLNRHFYAHQESFK